MYGFILFLGYKFTANNTDTLLLFVIWVKQLISAWAALLLELGHLPPPILLYTCGLTLSRTTHTLTLDLAESLVGESVGEREEAQVRRSDTWDRHRGRCEGVNEEGGG